LVYNKEITYIQCCIDANADYLGSVDEDDGDDVVVVVVVVSVALLNNVYVKVT